MLRPILLISAATILIACDRQNDKRHIGEKPLTTPITDTFFVPLDTINKMTDSYIASIALDSPEKIRSWNIDADALRGYLADGNIKSINISLAHNLDYINSGHYGDPACLSPDAMTIIVSGAASNGSTIYYNSSYLLNRAKPCPPICLTSTSLFKK